MRPRDTLVKGAAWLAVLAILLTRPTLTGPLAGEVAAPVASTVSVTIPSDEIGDLLRLGRQMEVERRWGEALTHYEDALRAHPNDRSLRQRFDFVRLHYDVGRRYADRSFLGSMEKSSFQQTLDLYDQVLLKIQTHYFEMPQWKELVERGTNNLEVALSEPSFVAQNLSGVEQSSIDAFRRELRRVIGARLIRSHTDARAAVAVAAELAWRRLNAPRAAVVLEYLCGATNSLDLYSAFLTPGQLDEVYAQIEGNFVGLGIELKVEDGVLLIVRVISGSPAEEAGLRTGDRIASVDGKSARGLSTDEAAALLQGEAGSLVELVVSGGERSPRTVRIRRRRVEVPSIDNVEMLDPDRGIAYFQLVCFQKTTCRDLKTVLWRLHREGMKSLIIDLRGNPGGLLVTAVEVADAFVERGIIVSTRGRSVREDFTYSAHTAGTWRTPLVLIIDRNSASAAEIFAGAIRDHRRGTVVGTRSFGKGSVQGIFPLSSSTSGVRLTTAKFYSPTGRPYSRTGVEPHQLVQLAARPLDGRFLPSAADKDDPVLDTALQAARRMTK